MKRIAWVDVLKFLGIAAIYFWHLGEGIGVSFQIILRYHVPLFFFLSGATESMQKETCFSTFFKRKVRTLLIPYFLFALLSMVLVILYERAGWPLIFLMVKQIAVGGLRNRIFAYSLWFLTCLFFCTMVFGGLRKLLKKRGLLLLAGGVIYVITARFLPYKPELYPLLPYNADAALYYLFYYIAGYCVFPRLNVFLEKKSKYKGVLLWGGAILAAVYAAGLFFGRDFLTVLEAVPGVRIFKPVFAAFLLIEGNVTVAYVLRRCTLLQRLGKESLYLCGNEFLIKTLAVWVLSAFGAAPVIHHPLHGLIYVLLLLLIQHFTLIPLEKNILENRRGNT